MLHVEFYTRIIQLSTFNFQLSTLNSQLSTLNFQLSTLNIAIWQYTRNIMLWAAALTR